MIGRQAELRALQDSHYDIIEDRERQIVTIVGEAGLGAGQGQARLVAEGYQTDTVFRLQRLDESLQGMATNPAIRGKLSSWVRQAFDTEEMPDKILPRLSSSKENQL